MDLDQAVFNLNNCVFDLVREGKISILKYMFEKSLKKDFGHYVNSIVDGQTLLIVAIKNNHYDIVEYLVKDCKVDIEQTGTVSFDGETIEDTPPLWLASALGNLKIVELLVRCGANVNSTTKSKSCALRSACYDGHLDVVKYLIKHGADIELTNRHGHTCLMIASFKGHYDIVKYLIEQGADVNKRSIKGNSALHDASEANQTEIFKLLIENNAKMIEDSCKITPLLAAALNGCESILHLIINYDESKSLCTEIEKINALELIGATFVDKKRNICKGINYWKIGFKRRLDNIKRLIDNKHVKEGEIIETYQKKIIKPHPAYNNAQEFNSLQELEQIIANVDDVRMQSLLIRERVLGQNHADTTYYIRFRGAVYADAGNFEMCIKLWLYALDNQQKSLDPLSPLTQSSLFSFAELFSYMISNKSDFVSFEQMFSVFKRALFELKSAILILPNKKVGHNKHKFNKLKLLQRISGNELREDCLEDDLIRGLVDNLELISQDDFILNNNLNNPSDQLFKNFVSVDNSNINLSATNEMDNKSGDSKDDLESINFHRILIILQIFIGLLCRLKSSITDDQLYRLKKAIYQLIKLNPKGNNGGLLHQACKSESCQLVKFPICDDRMPMFDIISMLLDCGADVNAVDSHKNTPLHLITSSSSKSKPNNSIIKLLIQNGSHLDAKNEKGECPLDFLKSNPTFLSDNQIYLMKHLSLQCLCAQVISKNNLSYKNFLPRQVSDFVKIH